MFLGLFRVPLTFLNVAVVEQANPLPLPSGEIVTDA